MTRDRTAWKEFGRAVVRAREAQGWSQRELAAEADISPTSLGEVERGEKDPTRTSVVAPVAQALGWPNDAADRYLAGDKDFLYQTELHSKIAKLSEAARERIEREIDEELGL